MRRAVRICAGLFTCLASMSATSSPAAAQSATDAQGGGTVGLMIHFSEGPTPFASMANSVCGPTAFTFSGGSQAAVISLSSVQQTGIYGYIGPVALSGGGGSFCENSGFSLVGGVTLSATGNGGLGTFSCPLLQGAYFRVGITVEVAVGGDCNIDGPTYYTQFTSAGVFEPTAGDGVTTPVTDGEYLGAFNVAA